GEIVVDVMQERFIEPPPRAAQADLGMDAASAPHLAVGFEERGLGGRPVIGAPAVTDERAADMIGHRDEEIAVIGRRNCAADGGGERRGGALIGIDLEDPVAATRGDRRVAPWPLQFPYALEDART